MRDFSDTPNVPRQPRSVARGAQGESDDFGARGVFKVIEDEDSDELLGSELAADFESSRTTDPHIPFHGNAPQSAKKAQPSLIPGASRQEPKSPESSASKRTILAAGGAQQSFLSPSNEDLGVLLARLGSRLRGCRGLAFVERNSYQVLCWNVSGDIRDVELRARELASLFAAKSNVLSLLQPGVPFYELVLTTTREIFIVAALPDPSPLLLFCNLHSATGNLFLAQYEMNEAIDSLYADKTRH